MSRPIVSIIVPVFNTEKYLEECIESLINQSYKQLDIILVDDGSTDRSASICDRYATIDERIRVIHVENGGVSNARNTGLNIAKGEWIFFCDSDDRITTNAIDICSKHFENNDFIRFSAYHVYTDRTVEKIAPIICDKESFLKGILSRKVGLGVCGGIYKTQLFTDGNIRFDSNLYMGEDWLVLARLCIKSKSPIGIKEKLYYYNRVSETSCVNSISFDKWINCFQAFSYIKYYTKQETNNDYSAEYNTAKIKIYIECLKSCALIDKKFSNMYKLLAYNNYIPSINDIHKSTVNNTIKAVAFIACSHYGARLFVMTYRWYCQINKK